jgi:hypothetical protein
VLPGGLYGFACLDEDPFLFFDSVVDDLYSSDTVMGVAFGMSIAVGVAIVARVAVARVAVARVAVARLAVAMLAVAAMAVVCVAVVRLTGAGFAVVR